MTDRIQDLREVVERATSSPPDLPRKALVLVHGIFSSHVTFEPLVDGLLRVRPELESWGLYYFDYDFHQSIPTSGVELGSLLQALLQGGDDLLIAMLPAGSI